VTVVHRRLFGKALNHLLRGPVAAARSLQPLLGILLLLVALPTLAGAEGLEKGGGSPSFSGVAIWERNGEALVVELAVGNTPLGPYRWSVVEGANGRTTLCWQKYCRSHLHEEGIAIVDRFDDALGSLPTRPVVMEMLAGTYAVESLPDETRWGRTIGVQRLVPRDDWRFAQRWWLDRTSQVVVERRIETTEGETLERFALVRFLPAEGLSFFEVRQKWAALGRLASVDLVLQPRAPEEMPGRLTQLPPGFRVTACGVRQGPSGQPVWQWVVSDGVVALSLFAEALVGARAESELSSQSIERVGAMGIARQVRDGWLHTAIGEVPDKTLRALLDSVVWAVRENHP
jgi:negative regulator of sigma E activity